MCCTVLFRVFLFDYSPTSVEDSPFVQGNSKSMLGENGMLPEGN